MAAAGAVAGATTTLISMSTTTSLRTPIFRAAIETGSMLKEAVENGSTIHSIAALPPMETETRPIGSEGMHAAIAPAGTQEEATVEEPVLEIVAVIAVEPALEIGAIAEERVLEIAGAIGTEQVAEIVAAIGAARHRPATWIGAERVVGIAAAIAVEQVVEIA